MSTSLGLSESQKAWEAPLVKPVDEAVWHAWIAKGREQDRQGSAAHVKHVKLILVAGLLAVAALWSQFTPYEAVVRFLVAAGAIFVMVEAFRTRQYAFAAVLGALALLYNPIAPVFHLSGDWQRVVVAMSSFPFVASLAWGNPKLAPK